MIDLETLFSSVAVRERNRKRSLYEEKHICRCLLCEAPMKKAIIAGDKYLSYVAAGIHVCFHCNRVLAHGERCPDGYNEDDRGGCGTFPVGYECLKRVPKEYRE